MGWGNPNENPQWGSATSINKDSNRWTDDRKYEKRDDKVRLSKFPLVIIYETSIADKLNVEDV